MLPFAYIQQNLFFQKLVVYAGWVVLQLAPTGDMVPSLVQLNHFISP